MTVSVPDVLYREYVADGGATTRSIGFALRSTSDLVVAAAGVPQVEGQHYAVTGITPNQRILPLAPFWPSGTVISYWRHTAREQDYEIPAGVDIRNESLEDELDRVQMQQQEQDDDIRRAIKVPRGEAGLLLDPAAARDGGIAQFVGQRLAGLPLAELAVMLDPQKKAGTTLAYTEAVAPRSEIDVFNPGGIGEGGYWCEFAVGELIPFVRAYARVYAGTGTCNVQMTARGQVVWSKTGVGNVAVDETINFALEPGNDLILTVENITGTVTGLVVKLEGEPA